LQQIRCMSKANPVIDIDQVMTQAQEAFLQYRSLSLQARSGFLEAIAAALDRESSALIDTASRETHLEPGRLRTELQRTQWQLYSYGKACKEGAWLDIRINSPALVTQEDQGQPGVAWQQHKREHDLRKMLIPLGPVVVFGASNFPFAYSTAGGDTACALAAGCPVVLKAHPAHLETSKLVAACIASAAESCGLPAFVFQHVEGGLEEGQALVLHPATRAVGFTGSLEGGRALFDLAQKRPVPIPVFAEMGSVNPVFILPCYLADDPVGLANKLVTSVTGSAGQFCTKPGLVIAIGGDALEHFADVFADAVSMVPPVEMLHPGIAKSFQHKRAAALEVEGVAIAGTLSCPVGRNDSIPTLARVSGADFIANPLLHQEVFGPYALLITCTDIAEMAQVATMLEGQLTATVFALTEELRDQPKLVSILLERCGRFIRNGVPTGVEVVAAMHHGGPYPATTDSRFTAVGADGIRRFARPVCYQNWEDELLPPELQDANPLGISRMINGRVSIQN
jgi:alpha-ketoglutaric semialdehyde dehydrogenase